MLHIPLLRKGRPYKSLDVVRLPHHRTREPFVEISQANAGLIRRDLLQPEAAREALAGFTHAEMIAMCVRAADFFAEDTLPLGDTGQSPQDYIEQVSATTGLPHVLARKNLEKIRTALAQMEAVVNGLTRHLDLAFAAVDQDDVRHHAFAVGDLLVAAREHLAHGGVVIAGRDVVDVVAAVFTVLHRMVMEHHARGLRGFTLRMADVEALGAQFVQVFAFQLQHFG